MQPHLRLQEQARALGDPTRYRIYRYLIDTARPVDVAELTRLTKLNHNAVRQHLAKLREAALILEEHEERHAPGRPRLLYRPDPAAAGDWLGPSPFERLAGNLAEALHEGTSAYDVGYRAGRDLAATAPDGDTIDVMEALTEHQGFQPRRSTRGRRIDLVLETCPFASVADRYPDVVCELHRGLVQGLADAAGAVEVTDLVVRPAFEAGCRIRLRRTT